MFRIITLISFSLIAFSCNNKSIAKPEQQDEAFRSDHKQLFAEVKKMLAKDQEIRNLRQYGDTDTAYMDSLTKYYADRLIDLDSMLLQNDTFLVTKRLADFIDRLMTTQGEKHTARVIAMIGQYDYPESMRLDTITNVSPFLLLHHPSPKYKDTLRNLLTKELSLKRIDSISYEFILWDLDGREGLPPVKGMKSTKHADGTTTIEL